MIIQRFLRQQFLSSQTPSPLKPARFPCRLNHYFILVRSKPRETSLVAKGSKGSEGRIYILTESAYGGWEMCVTTTRTPDYETVNRYNKEL